jgi:polar amino acid transport system substrate-binding protein
MRLPEFPEKKTLNASLGIAVHRQDESAETLIARVDKALYRAKKHGRDRVEVARGGEYRHLLKIKR